MELGQSPTQAETIKLNWIGCPVSKFVVGLHTDYLFGIPLIQEVVKLAATTVAFYIAREEGITFTPPEGDFRTMSNVEELVRFAAKEFANPRGGGHFVRSNPHAVTFAQTVLRNAEAEGIETELDFAKLTVATYCELQGMLAESTSWTMPSQDEVLLLITNSSRPVAIEEIKTIGTSTEMDLTKGSF